MKVLITLALVAIATAVPLPEQEGFQPIGISTLPLFIPDDIAEAFRKDLELNPPINSDVEESLFNDFEPIVLGEIPVPEVFEELEEVDPFPVQFVDAPVEEEIAPSPIQFVDEVVEAAAEEVDPSALQFVDSPVGEEEVALSSEQLAEEIEAYVNFVLSALAEEESFVQFVDSIVEEVEPSNVNFVDAPVEEEIALPADEVAEIAEEPVAEEIEPSPVNFVEAVADDEGIVPSPINFVEDAENAEEPIVAFAEAPLESEDGPEYPGLVHDDPLWR